MILDKAKIHKYTHTNHELNDLIYKNITILIQVLIQYSFTAEMYT
jgi:hypothetical protein